MIQVKRQGELQKVSLAFLKGGDMGKCNKVFIGLDNGGTTTKAAVFDMKGNELLVRNAAMLRGIAEHSDGICGRLGNDQFALLIPKRHFREELLLNMEAELAEIFNSVLPCQNLLAI